MDYLRSSNQHSTLMRLVSWNSTWKLLSRMCKIATIHHYSTRSSRCLQASGSFFLPVIASCCLSTVFCSSPHASADFEGHGGEEYATALANIAENVILPGLNLKELCILKEHQCWALNVDAVVRAYMYDEKHLQTLSSPACVIVSYFSRVGIMVWCSWSCDSFSISNIFVTPYLNLSVVYF